MRSTYLLVLLAACESFHSGGFVQQDAPPPDIDGPMADAHIPVPRALAASGDFGSPGVGVLSKFEVTNLAMTTNVTPGSALGDPVLRQIGNRVYVINRYGSNAVTILEDALSRRTDLDGYRLEPARRSRRRQQTIRAGARNRRRGRADAGLDRDDDDRPRNRPRR